ncbi:MAG: translation initiation factor [bacterium]
MSAPQEYPLVWSSHPKPSVPREPELGGLPPLGQRVLVRREVEGRNGKTVTALWGFQASERQLDELGRALRKALGVGGSSGEGRVEIQGDKVKVVLEWLSAKGYKAVKAGG